MSPDDQRFDPGVIMMCHKRCRRLRRGAQFLTELGRYKRLQFNAGGGSKRRVVHHHALFGFRSSSAWSAPPSWWAGSDLD
jgi:hypothetical protein